MPVGLHERSLRWLSQRAASRRSSQRRRKQTYLMIGLASVIVAILSLPSLIVLSPLADSLLANAAGRYGWTARAHGIRLGWITPLRLDEVEFTGPSGETHLRIGRLNTSLTLTDLMRGRLNGSTVSLRDVDAQWVLRPGATSLEEDLEVLRAAWEEDDSAGSTGFKVEVEDAIVQMIEAADGGTWRAEQVQAVVDSGAERLVVQLDGVVTDPQGASGALETLWTRTGIGPESLWRVESTWSGVPLSWLRALRSRFPQWADAMPASIDGDLRGRAALSYGPGESLRVEAQGLDLRNLVVADSRWAPQPWRFPHAAVDGALTYEAARVRGERLRIATEAGAVTLDGNLRLGEAGALPIGWVDALEGSASAEVDLAILGQSAPGLIPLREGAAIRSGRVVAAVQGGVGADGQYRSHWTIHSEPIRALAAGRTLVFEPIQAELTLRPAGRWLAADALRVRSAFGDAAASGSLRSGNAHFNLNFDRLSSMLQPLVDLPEASLRGVASGTVRWAATGDDRWNLSGEATGTNLTVALPGGRLLRRPSVELQVAADGVIAGDRLEQLTRTRMTLSDPDQRWEAELVEAINRPDAQTALPLRLRGEGRLDALFSLLAPWMPASLSGVEGNYQAKLHGDVALHSGRVTSAVLSLDDMSAIYRRQRIFQPSARLHFEGHYDWPSGDVYARTLTVQGTAVSAAIQGQMNAETVDMEVAWLTDVGRLQDSITHLPAALPLAATPLAPGGTFAAARVAGGVAHPGWRYRGQIEGRADVVRRPDDGWQVTVDASGRDLALIQPPPTSAASGFVGPVQPTRGAAPEFVAWAEPQMTVVGQLRIHPDSAQMMADGVRIVTPWVDSRWSGQGRWSEGRQELRLSGPAQFDMAVVARRLEPLLGQPMQLVGMHRTPIELAYTAGDDQSEGLQVKANLGWQSGEIAGVGFGAATVPIRMNDNVVFVQPASIPLEQGRLNVAGEVHYRPGPLWFEQRPGMLAEGVRLRPEMCRSWLKYVTPLLADATEVSGAFNLELDEAVVIPSDPHRSRVAGRLQVIEAQVGPGPLAAEVVGTLEQLENAVAAVRRGTQNSPSPPTPARPRRWMTMPSQTVDFTLVESVVRHQRMQMQVGQAALYSSGAVGLDGQLNLRVQVPLESRWLGQELAGLTGQSLTLPIEGTLARPRLDARATTEVLTQLGTQAVQSAASNVLQRELNRGLQRVLGR